MTYFNIRLGTVTLRTLRSLSVARKQFHILCSEKHWPSLMFSVFSDSLFGPSTWAVYDLMHLL